MFRKSVFTVFFSATLIVLSASTYSLGTGDELPSWNDGPNKQHILQFVQQVTDKTNPNYVEPSNRIATIDNDGTLWVEQPIYTQVQFAFARVKALAPQHPEWKTTMPFSAILKGDQKAIENFSMEDLVKILMVTQSGMSVDEYNTLVSNWLATAENPHFHKPFTALVYKPMLEVMQYLRDNGFTIYIVSGGGQDFMRAFSQRIYNIDSQHVIGTAGKTKYSYQNKKPVLIKLPEVLFVDDKEGKPQSIDLFIGRKPIIAFGNSDGDRQMLEWTQSGSGQRLMFLVHHDDAKREFAYGPESKVGTFSDSLMTEAKDHGWGVISMQHDWKDIF